MGFAVDKFKIWPLVILSFLVRAIGLFIIPSVETVYGIFIVVFCINVGTALEFVVLTSLLNKNLARPIRELMNSAC